MGNINTTFIPNVWIKCIHNNVICIGRTYYRRDSNKNLEMVCLVTQDGYAQHVLFSKISDASILRIVTVCDFDVFPVVPNENCKQLIQKLASVQLNTLMS